MKTRGLGKGLDALFSVEQQEQENQQGLMYLSLTSVEPNNDQPRKAFDQEGLKSLADSISEHGVLQPIVVLNLQNGFYRIIAGERRWRAARMAGLTEIPALVRDVDKQSQMEIALIENLQRMDLDPIEEARGIKALIDQFNLTQEQISKRLGRSRSSVANSLRLLNLPVDCVDMLREGSISTGHAKLLLSVPSEQAQIEIANNIKNQGLSVKQTEKLCKTAVTNLPKTPKPNENSNETFQIHAKSFESDLVKTLGTKVRISNNGDKGKIQIDYYSIDDLNRIIDILLQKNNQ